MATIGRPHGVSGRIHVTCHAADPAGLIAYGPLSDANGQQYVLRWCHEGVAEISTVVDGASERIRNRTAVEKLTNTELFIDRSALPPPDEEEFYLADLIGLMAVDAEGKQLGIVSTVHDYGAGTSLEIAREVSGEAALIVPFTQVCVPEIDIVAGRLVVAPPIEVPVIAEDAV
ncbi:MAG: ribosome maturation factor RimM [Rhodospirillales bacterium]